MTYMDNELKFSKNAPKKYIFKIIYIYIQKKLNKNLEMYMASFFSMQKFTFEKFKKFLL